jgi:hypothetical protein
MLRLLELLQELKSGVLSLPTPVLTSPISVLAIFASTLFP